MNHSSSRLLKVVLLLAAILGFAAGGWWWHSRYLPPRGVPVPASLIAELGVNLPPGTVLVEDLDDQGGGSGHRESELDYHIWSFYSPNQIQMPAGPRAEISALATTLENSVAMLNHYFAGRKIPEPTHAFGSRWVTGPYRFEGTVVRSHQGDYLHIQRLLNR